MESVKSKNGIPIRLPEERWIHITEEHSEMAGYYYETLETVEAPDEIYKGNTGELLAVKAIEPGKFIIVFYKEDVSKNDGFILTSFLTRQIKKIRRRERVWSKK